ncbi:hypothetical protein CBOM_05874 [Ceraceosorus bombacis]|uniref:Uncharacterized protein n=1 Tax=Ceraceosorus bombacis TaxID=401625 RepID=A0A0P1BSZ2_9BASI|nr:hypothetical protein CBOM_05874 [Ceraceosorus bombacis]
MLQSGKTTLTGCQRLSCWRILFRSPSCGETPRTPLHGETPPTLLGWLSSVGPSARISLALKGRTSEDIHKSSQHSGEEESAKSMSVFVHLCLRHWRRGQPNGS